MRSKYFLIIFLFLSINLHAQQMSEHWYRSQAAVERNEYSIALKYIDSCLIKKEKSYIFLGKKGEIQFDQGEYQDALESLLKADKLKQGSSSFLLAKSYCAIGDTASCFKWLKTYLGQNDKQSEGFIKLDPIFEKVSSTKQWKAIWSKEWYSPYEKLIADVEYSLQNNNWDDALDLLNPRLKGSKPRPQLLVLRAEAFDGLGSHRTAIDDYSLAIKKSKKNYQYLAGRAKAYFANQKNSQAIKDLTKAIDLSGGKPQYFRIRAEVYYANNQFKEAYDDINIYLSYYPSDSDASFLLAKIAIEYGSYVDALFGLGKLIKSNPSEAKYYYFRGVAYIKTENYKVAETDLNIAISKGYNLSDSYYQRGIARYKQGEKNIACDDWEQAVKLGNFKSQELLYNNCNKSATIKKW